MSCYCVYVFLVFSQQFGESLFCGESDIYMLTGVFVYVCGCVLLVGHGQHGVAHVLEMFLTLILPSRFSSGALMYGLFLPVQFSHLAWIQTDRKSGGLGDLRYPIVSDITKKISKAFQVLIPDQVLCCTMSETPSRTCYANSFIMVVVSLDAVILRCLAHTIHFLLVSSLCSSSYTHGFGSLYAGNCLERIVHH